MEPSASSFAHRRRLRRGAGTLLFSAALWPTAFAPSLGAESAPQSGEVALSRPDSCGESSTALCLLGNRFRVTVEWSDFLGRRGTGHSLDLTDDSGLFWFFEDSNLELLVKMVDGCGEFSRFWVFAAATTNLEYTVQVTDTVTDSSRTYFNRLGQSSPAITDTDAFATCL